ncbi:MAG: ABC transporter permease [Flavobacteriales bacterium]|nr:ABC transporter permease [Flavobacteriales bacterium]
MDMIEKDKEWDLIITPKKSFFSVDVKSIWKYRDLLTLFVKKDFISVYKQTVLGPVWFFVQPILTTITFTVIFGNVAKISTDGLPKILFYMAGITLWNYFAECLNKTSNTFVVNQGIFGKVYFPRIITPLSVVINCLLKLAIQLFMFAGFWCYYYFVINIDIMIKPTVFLLPLLIVVIAIMGLGFGMIISSMTTKYRDLTFLVGFGVQLLMYTSPVIYPLSAVPEQYKWLIMLNPMSSIIELFKYSLLGVGYLDWFWLGYSVIISIVLFIVGFLIFNKVEKSFIDTV